MSFPDAIRICLTQRYADFSGRARRSEYWWFVLFLVLTNAVLSVVDVQILRSLVWLALIVPSVAVLVRRLHDVGKQGILALLFIIPIVNVVLALLWFTKDGDPGVNEYGANPKVAGSYA